MAPPVADRGSGCNCGHRRPGVGKPADHPEDAEAVYQELRANAVPNGHFMAAGVVGLTRAQEFGYSVLIAG